MCQLEKLNMLALSLLLVSGAFLPALSQYSEPPDRPKRMEDPDVYYRTPSTNYGKMMVLPIGTTFAGRVDHTISSEHSKAGQRFSIVVDTPVLVNGTDVVIPQGSQIICEVVEAVPANAVPRQPWDKKILTHGKLRIEITSLRTPDGATYPLVASLAGEKMDSRYAYMDRYRNPFGTNVGYVGTQQGFAASGPNAHSADDMRRRGLGTPTVMGKKDFMKDEVMGFGPDQDHSMDQYEHPRSLVLHKRDYYIYQGSPLTVRVKAPFKIGMVDPGQGVAVGTVSREPMDPDLPRPTRLQAPPPFAGATDRPYAVPPGAAAIPAGAAPPAGAPQQPTYTQPPGPPGAVIPADSF
jgi:hypothetical protein